MSRVLHSPVRIDAPQLSVLVPFYRDDPTETLCTIAQQADRRVEILAWDDGTDDPVLTQRISDGLSTLDADVRVHSNTTNRGRSHARNALVASARAPWVLFLDADMVPDNDNFLENYLDAIAADAGDVLFGGFTVLPRGPRATRLHRELTRRSDCDPAAIRTLHGPKHVASSNLCIAAPVLEAEPFDPGFKGWGWEDSEWAARVAARYRLVHLDNPAIHLGLESTDTLLRRFATSGPNYARFARAHPKLVQDLPLYRHARRLAALPGQAAMRPLLKALVKAPLPITLRILALKLWRASHYAPHITGSRQPLHQLRS